MDVVDDEIKGNDMQFVEAEQKLSVGFFGGVGFIQQKPEGAGLAFVHAGGTVMQREPKAGETLFVDTGCMVALRPSVDFEVQHVGKIKTALFGSGVPCGILMGDRE